MKRPNVLLISIDTLRADHLSCYGYHRKTTPNLDHVANDGVIYENAYSTAVWTPPAHASMLTGLYPSFHGAVDDNRLSKNIPTLAEVFLKNSYKTVGFVNNSQVGELVGFERGHETFIEVWRGTGGTPLISRGIKYLIRSAKEVLGVNDHGAHRTNQLARQWIKERKDDSFYMFIHHIEPHNPINPPHPFRNKYFNGRDDQGIDKKKLYLVAHNPLICFTDNIKLNDPEIEALKGLYDGEISYIDYKIGEFVNFLKKEDLYDNTLIVITADHGEHFGEHGLYSHVASLYEPILHIPLIIKYPEGFKKQTRISDLVQLIDIYPTLIEACGLDLTFLANVQGKSLFKKSLTQKDHDYIIAEWEGRIPDFVLKRVQDPRTDSIVSKFRQTMLMIREGSYKYILNSSGIEELYDLDKDRYEGDNIIETKKDIAASLRLKLTQWQSLRVRIEQEKQYSNDEAVRKNLETLGYI